MNEIGFAGAMHFLVLEALLEKDCYLRELAEKTQLAPSSVHKIVSLLEKQGIVSGKMHKNLKIFSINRNSATARSMLNLLFVNKLENAKAFHSLIRLKPEGIYLFGSASKGSINDKSDIDLSAYFKEKPDSIKLTKIKQELENELNKEIQFLVLTEKKLTELRKGNKELIESLKNSTLLWGDFFE